MALAGGLPWGAWQAHDSINTACTRTNFGTATGARLRWFILRLCWLALDVPECNINQGCVGTLESAKSIHSKRMGCFACTSYGRVPNNRHALFDDLNLQSLSTMPGCSPAVSATPDTQCTHAVARIIVHLTLAISLTVTGCHAMNQHQRPPGIPASARVVTRTLSGAPTDAGKTVQSGVLGARP